MRPNPLFSKINTGEQCYESEYASYKGVALKTFIYLGIAVLVAALTVIYLPQILSANFEMFMVVLGVSGIVGFISYMIGRFIPKTAKYAGALYAVCEGLFLGALTGAIELIYPGVAFLAVFSTLIIFSVTLTLFATGIIKVNKLFIKIAYVIGLSALAVVLFTAIYTMINGPIQNLGVVIAIQAFLILYGSITLTLNFTEAQFVVNYGCDKSAEWSVALGLTVTLIYIYIQLLRLLAIIASRRD